MGFLSGHGRIWVFDLCNEGRITFTDFQDLTSSNPERIKAAAQRCWGPFVVS